MSSAMKFLAAKAIEAYTGEACRPGEKDVFARDAAVPGEAWGCRSR